LQDLLNKKLQTEAPVVLLFLWRLLTISPSQVCRTIVLFIDGKYSRF
jgi:hypothetical protein